MRSLWGKAPFQFQLRELPMPEPDAGEVVVKVAACGICGTDLHFLRHNEDWTPLGHEVVGTIVAKLLKIRFSLGHPGHELIQQKSGTASHRIWKSGRTDSCRS